MHQVGPIEAVDVISGRKDDIASHVFDAKDRTRVRCSAHRLRLEHLLMRPRKRVDIQSTLAIGDFSVKDMRVLRVRRAGQH